MSADRTYTRVRFAPADACALGPVTIYAGDGVTKIGALPVKMLLARTSAVPDQRGPFMPPPGDERPSVLAVRRQKASRNLTKRNKAQRKKAAA